MCNPKFSIIVPVYNEANTIDQTITTLLSFDYVDYEVIFVNDGSTDQTRQLIEKLIKKNSNFYCITVENQGPGFARNIGIKKAKGTYILFFDADDLPNITILKDYDQLCTEYPETELIVSSFIFQTIDNDKVVSEKINRVTKHFYTTRQVFLKDLYYLMNKQLMYVVWNKCYRKDILVKYNICFKNYSSCEDRIFNLEYYQHCNYVLMNPNVEYIYKFEGRKGITNKYHPNKFKTFQEFYELANQVTDNKNPFGMASLFLKGTISVLLSIVESPELSSSEKKEKIKNIIEDRTVKEATLITSTDSTMKRLTKYFFKLPPKISCSFIMIAGKLHSFSPKLVALLKRKY